MRRGPCLAGEACVSLITPGFIRNLLPYLLVAMFFALSACTKAPLHQQESFVFGTRVEIRIAGLKEAQARPAAAAVLAEFDRLHRQFHAWQPSELSALNTALAAGKPHEVSPELAELLRDTAGRVRFMA